MFSCCESAVSQRRSMCRPGCVLSAFVYGVVFLSGHYEQQRLCSSGPSLCVRAQQGVGEQETQDWKVLWERGDLAGLLPVCHLIYMHWHVQTPRATGGQPIIPSARPGASGNDLPLRQFVTTTASLEPSGKFRKEKAVNWGELLVCKTLHASLIYLHDAFINAVMLLLPIG